MIKYRIKANVQRSYGYSLGDHLNDFWVTLWSIGISDDIPDSISLYGLAGQFDDK